MLQRSVFLIGYMASGKSTLGKALAKDIEAPFLDLDDEIERQQGRTISEIFAADGEDFFRCLEQKTLDVLLARIKTTPTVVALGGGTPCREGVMEKLNVAGVTVYLQTSTDRIVERLLIDAGKRPLAAGKTSDQLKDDVSTALKHRETFYCRAAATFDSSLLENEEQVLMSVDKFKKLIFENYVQA